MADEDKIKAMEAEIATLKKSHVDLAEALQGARTERDAAVARTQAWEGTLAEGAVAPYVERLVHPSVASLLPKPQIDPQTGKVTEEWRKAMDAWEQEHGSLLKPATPGRTATPGAPNGGPGQGAPGRPSTPTADPRGGVRDIHYWRRLQAEHPAEFRARWQEYTAFMQQLGGAS